MGFGALPQGRSQGRQSPHSPPSWGKGAGGEGEQLKTLFERKENRHLIGAELLLRNNVEYEESKQRQDIYEMLKVCIEKGGGCHR